MTRNGPVESPAVHAAGELLCRTPSPQAQRTRGGGRIRKAEHESSGRIYWLLRSRLRTHLASRKNLLQKAVSTRCGGAQERTNRFAGRRNSVASNQNPRVCSIGQMESSRSSNLIPASGPPRPVATQARRTGARDYTRELGEIAISMWVGYHCGFSAARRDSLRRMGCPEPVLTWAGRAGLQA